MKFSEKKELFKQCLKNAKREVLREDFVKRILSFDINVYKKMKYSSEELELLLFDYDDTGFKRFSSLELFMPIIDFEHVSFDNFRARGVDFSKFNNVHINPQTVCNKDLRDTKLEGVTFTGPFDDCYIPRADFTGSINAVIDIDKLYDKDIKGAILTDVTLISEKTLTK